jgi:hypothetical protein
MIDTANQQSLRPEEIARARKNGGVTFSPRGCNKLVCNQAPRLGLISHKLAASLRKQVYSGSQVKAPAKSAISQTLQKAIRPNPMYWVDERRIFPHPAVYYCPYCFRGLAGKPKMQEDVCPNCNKIFLT